MDLYGQSAIVTGGASGLGEATARMVSKNGAKVAILDLNEERGKNIANDIGGIFSKCDVVNRDSIQAGLSLASEKHGASRILVNCAGIAAASRVVGRTVHMIWKRFRKLFLLI